MRFNSLSKRSEQQNNDYGSDKDVLQPFPMGAEHRHRSRRLSSGLLSVNVGVGITSEDLTPTAVDLGPLARDRVRASHFGASTAAPPTSAP